MIKAVIIDDEVNARNALKSILKEYCQDVELIGEANSVESGKNLILSLKPALVFLDVQMNDGTGFDLLTQLPDMEFKIIFASAYDRFAINAFRFSAIDYILKPIEPALLVEAIERVRKETNALSLHQKLEVLLESNSIKFKKIALPSQEGITFVETADIIRCESDNNYTNIYLKDGTRILVSKTLKEYDEMLSPLGFCRVHKSHLINPAFLKKYLKGDGGVAVMEDGAQIDVSRRRKEHFLRTISG